MAAVYSGGLVYEYSEEENGYGLVNLNSGSVVHKDDFAALQSAFAANPAPSGDAGARTSASGASVCPGTSTTFDIEPWTGDYLPAMPSDAVKYLQNGAGRGPGLTGSGSQDSPGGSTTTATPGSASVSGVAAGASGASGASGATRSSGAAVALNIPDLGAGPFVSVGIMLIGMLMGAALL